MAIALERLEAGTPFSYTWSNCDPSRFFFLIPTPDKAMLWTKQECRYIHLKRAVLYGLDVIHDKQARILK
jgi:hypothetical protein